FTRVPLYSLVFLCRATGGKLTAHPLETRDVGWFARDAMPEPLAGADQWLDHAFRAIDGEEVGVLYDEPRERPWAEGGAGVSRRAGACGGRPRSAGSSSRRWPAWPAWWRGPPRRSASSPPWCGATARAAPRRGARAPAGRPGC